MKRQGFILHKMVMLATFIALAVGVGHTQDGIKTKIPFNFNIGAQEFPAGEYTLMPELPLQHTMLLRNRAGQVVASIPTDSVQSAEGSGSTKLVFTQYGQQYFLAQVWSEGSELGQQLVKSHAEIETARAK